MNNKELYSYAFAGAIKQLETLEKEIKQGYKMLRDFENAKTTKTREEIKIAIEEKEREYKKIDKDFDSIKWILSTLENE